MIPRRWRMEHILRIGVALSGCDIGAVVAYTVLRELERQGFEIGMISTCGMPSATALLYAYGCEQDQYKKMTARFLTNLAESDIDMALAEFSAALPLDKLRQEIPIAISAVNVPDGKIYTFTLDYTVAVDRLITFPLENSYDSLSATISPAEGLASYLHEGFRLCDFSVWYGCPIYPLSMAGPERIVSIAFVPSNPKTPYEVLMKQKIAHTAHFADVHIPILFDGISGDLSRYIEIATLQVRSCIEDACMKILF